MTTADDADLEAIVGAMSGERKARLTNLLQSGKTDALVRELYEAGLVTNRFDWVEWNAGSGTWDAERTAGVSIADAVRLITTIVRGDRFNEGLLDSKLADGTLPAAVQRVLDA